MSLFFEGWVYIFEFKMLDKKLSPGNALAQIKAKGYGEKYMEEAEMLCFVGVEFCKKDRNIKSFLWELQEKNTD